MGIAAAQSATLSKKVQKALALRIDSQTSRDALRCLSGFFNENTVHTRRNLRSSIEGQNLCLHQEFVDTFAELERQLEGLEGMVNTLDAVCDRAGSELRRSRHETQVILDRASTLRRESKAIGEKQQVLEKFLAKFRLSETDTAVLKSGDRPIDKDFFQAFEKLETVRSNARQMLSTCGQQTSGVDILHETSEILEASYERMFVWVQQQCRTSSSAGAVSRSSSTELDTTDGAVLKRALGLLAERPVYFNHCIRDISRVRRQALAQRFFEALSQGDAGSRPIELQACDAERYVGAMLAWIHQNVATERDAIAALMGRGGKDAKPGTGGPQTLESEPGAALVNFEDILDFTLEGVQQPFTIRVRQALEAQTAIVSIYKVSQVLSFYAKTLEDLTPGKDNCLVSMCRELHARTHQSFLDLWEAQAQRLRQGAGIYVSDVATPHFVVEAVSTLSEVLAIYERAPIPAEEREMDFLPVLSAAFDPLLNHCQQVAAMMDSADGQVFLVNCVAAMQEPLRKHAFTAQRVAMYAAILDDQVKLLVDGQASAVLAKLGLAERLKALREKPAGVSVREVPELHEVSLSAALRQFYNSLFTLGGALSLPLLERIASRGLRSEARNGVSGLIAAAYEELYEGIKELGVATHTPEQVKTLLE